MLKPFQSIERGRDESQGDPPEKVLRAQSGSRSMREEQLCGVKSEKPADANLAQFLGGNEAGKSKRNGLRGGGR